MKKPKKHTPGYLHLANVYDVNSSWRDILSDAAFRAAIFDCGDDFEEIVDYFNECGDGTGAKATVDDLNDFLVPSIVELQKDLKRWEEDKQWPDIYAHFFWRAAEDCDTEALLECLEETYPGFHAFVLENRED